MCSPSIPFSVVQRARASRPLYFFKTSNRLKRPNYELKQFQNDHCLSTTTKTPLALHGIISLTNPIVYRKMSGNQVILFLILGTNEPLYEAEIHKRGGAGNSDAVARQNYFVVHSALDLVEQAAWRTQNVRSYLVEIMFVRQCSVSF